MPSAARPSRWSRRRGASGSDARGAGLISLSCAPIQSPANATSTRTSGYPNGNARSRRTRLKLRLRSTAKARHARSHAPTAGRDESPRLRRLVARRESIWPSAPALTVRPPTPATLPTRGRAWSDARPGAARPAAGAAHSGPQPRKPLHAEQGAAVRKANHAVVRASHVDADGPESWTAS